MRKTLEVEDQFDCREVEAVVFRLPESLSRAISDEADKQKTSTVCLMENLLAMLHTVKVTDLYYLKDPPDAWRSGPVTFRMDSKHLELLFGAVLESGLSQSQIMSRVLYALLVAKELKIVVSDWKVKLQRKCLSSAKSQKHR